MMIKSIVTLATVLMLAQVTLLTGVNSQTSRTATHRINFADLVAMEERQLPSLANPTCCTRYYDHRHANSNSARIMQGFNQRISSMQLAIIEALRLSTGQVSGTTREQTAAQHSLADKQDDRSTVKAVEQARLGAIRDSAPGTASCSIISGSAGESTGTHAHRVSSDLAVEVGTWSEGDPTMPSSLGPDQSALALTGMHCDRFATSKSVAMGLCDNIGSLPGADTSIAKSIFHQSDKVGYRLPEERIEASKAFILTATDPTPVRPISDAQANTPQGRIAAALRNASIARVSTANETLSYLISQRVPIQDESIRQWATARSRSMRGLETADYSQGVSQKDWLRLQSQQFLLDPDWIRNSDTNLATATKATKNVLAVIAYQEFENYKLLERIVANLAIQTAILNSK